MALQYPQSNGLVPVRLSPPILCLIALTLAGCQTFFSDPPPEIETRPFRMKNVAKSDVDLVTETNIRMTLDLLRDLAIKLYKRNPQEWRKAGYEGPEQAAWAIFLNDRKDAAVLGGSRSIDALRLTFEEGYGGDRVYALVEGIRTMILAAYKGKQEFYMLDDLDPQKIYNAARNIELAAWKLGNERDSAGSPFLLSNELEGPVKNLSFERVFGKMIALQDSMARIIADKNNRNIKNVIQSLARAVFLPI
ncbi:MAG: hypothetical protein KJ558_11940 [Gammaproteobacteria bacterium]|nr:hypothetical protein [Gammaproteobacteria bacterium]MBU1655515.1 hypothetical protein [Gammaproteobacteria bacterium]MBU1961263.1 hypothetical protein [Gammaproteobacteria bacterium]